MSDSGDSSQATPEKGPDSTGDGLPDGGPTRGEVQQAAHATQWPGEVSRKQACFLLSSSGVCLACAVLPNLTFSGAVNLCLL